MSRENSDFIMIFKKLFQLPYLPITLAPIVLFSPLLFGGKVLFWGTPGLQFMPWWTFSWETLLDGHLPLWNPLLGMGVPLLANYQSALFYPPTWIYLLFYAAGGIGTMAWAQALVLTLHLILSGVGMAKLARRLGWDALAQTLAGLAYALSGYLVARAWFASINATVAWLPWALLAAYAAVEQPALRRWARLGLVLGLQLLAGHAQTAWYTLLLTGAWILFWAWVRAHEARRWRALLKAAGGYLLAGLGSAALAAVQLLPTVEYLLQSQRATAVDAEFALNYSFWPWRFITLIAPNFFGNPAHSDYWGYGNFWEDAVYIGLLPLLLALAALARRRIADDGRPVSGLRSPVIRFWGIAIFTAFLLALGKNTPVFPWLYQNFPTFDMFQAPTRFSLWAVVALALLAALGVQNWRRPEGRGLYWTRLGTASAFAVSMGAGLAYFNMGAVSPTFIRATALAGLWGLGAGALSLTAPPHEHKTRTRIWQWLVVLWIAADLLVAGWGLNPGAAPEFYTHSAPVVEGRIYLPPAQEYALKYERFLRFDTFNPGENWLDLRTAQLPNLNLLVGQASANNFDPFVPGRYARWMDVLEGLDANTKARILDLMAVAATEQVDAKRGSGVSFAPRGLVSRFSWVPCAVPASDAENAWEQTFSGEINFGDTVVLEGLESTPSRVCDSTLGQVTLEDEHPNALKFSIQSRAPGWLLLADVWYPGWRAWVDGEPVDVLRANYLFRAVEVPAGAHHVEFRYQPLLFYIGVFVSVLAWGGLGWALRSSHKKSV